MLQKTLMALAIASGVLIAGCGGGGGSDSDGGSSGGGTTARNDVVGPLDAVQEPVSSQVLAPLAVAAAGTPLAGVVTCVDQIVVGDTLDIVDVLAGQADAGATNFASSATVVQAEVTNLVSDLQRLLTSLAGGSGCSGSTVPVPGGFGTNPLAGTPLESFGATLLATLASVQSQLGGGGTPSLTTLSSVVDQLADGYAAALAMVPPEATSAPVVGPSLGLIGTALNDLTTTVAAAETANPTTTAAALAATVDHLLNGLLVDVLPIAQLEDISGQPGAISGPIADALAQLTAALSGGFATPGTDLGGTALLAEVQDLIGLITDPGTGTDPTGLLTGLLDQIQTALAGAVPGGTLPDIGPQALDEALAQITALLSTAGSTGTPLDDLLDSVIGLLGGLLGLDGLLNL